MTPMARIGLHIHGGGSGSPGSRKAALAAGGALGVARIGIGAPWPDHEPLPGETGA